MIQEGVGVENVEKSAVKATEEDTEDKVAEYITLIKWKVTIILTL